MSPIVILKVEVAPSSKLAFIDWQTRLSLKLASFEGFVSLEILASHQNQKSWVITQRFDQDDQVDAWIKSSSYQALIQELYALVGVEKCKEECHSTAPAERGVTEVFVTEVVPGKEQDFRKWLAKIHQAEASFPGFKGTYVQAPKEGKSWVTFLQFDNRENLENWLTSPLRQTILDESNPCIKSLESHFIVSPYAGWFSTLLKEGYIPAVWKQTMLVLLVLFPLVMLELKYLSPWLFSLNKSLATFIGNTISVLFIAWPMMPIALWFLGWWMSSSKFFTSLVGTGLVLLLYFLEILFFWNFLDRGQ